MGGVCLAYARQVPRWPYFVLKSYYTFQARLESLGSPGWSQMLSDLPVGLSSARIPCVRIMPMLCQFVFEDKLSQSWPGRPWTWNPSSAWARAGVTQVHYSVWLHIVFLICLHPNIHRRKWFHTFISTLQLYHITQCREMSQGFYCFGVGEPNAVLSFFFFLLGLHSVPQAVLEHTVQPDWPRTCGNPPAPGSPVWGLLRQLNRGLCAHAVPLR